jgi:hypothetical protein
MKRLPYDMVIAVATQLLNKAASSAEEMRFIYFEEYKKYLESCGWDDSSFDMETLKRIDQNWNDNNLN